MLAYCGLIFSVSSVQGDDLPGFFPYMDKIAHLLEYSLFGLLAGRAIRATFSGWSAVAFTIATVALGGLVGLLDEFYQRSVPGRQSDAFDLLVDMGAVAAAVLFAQWVHILPLGGGGPATQDKGR